MLLEGAICISLAERKRKVYVVHIAMGVMVLRQN